MNTNYFIKNVELSEILPKTLEITPETIDIRNYYQMMRIIPQEIDGGILSMSNEGDKYLLKAMTLRTLNHCTSLLKDHGNQGWTWYNDTAIKIWKDWSTLKSNIVTGKMLPGILIYEKQNNSQQGMKSPGISQYFRNSQHTVTPNNSSEPHTHKNIRSSSYNGKRKY